ncbi:cytochrome c oxidase assembly protein [Streptomyces sp. MST-110588]|uniref:cytochrome c oxidase assembly protein n=1 Tax=Streptomyces sp. MST-110588 TaxID=2833628 RepID=UPI001F5C786F|nr:cytochrome c oxidase assembly protein [Streptomyces sp. MST-110588]UNO38811.1 cytochrome c oxidase assembly protein [Streptomyces sp. MST-110588]
MTPPHLHPAPASPVPGLFEVVLASAALTAVAGYLLAAARLRRRGDAWPRARDAAFTTGGTALAAAVTLTLPGGPFTAHMAQHLVVGMAAPLLLVLARPLTLLLRTVGPGPARRGLLAVARSRSAAWLVFPPLAALLDVGGLWVLYRTPLLAATHHRPVLHALVHTHVLAAGLLFSFAVCRLDPLRHRWSTAWRGTTLLAAGAAHAVLAKTLYLTPPPGTAFGLTDLHTGAKLMYYGGDLVELALAAALAVQWYTSTGRAWARDRARTGAGAGTGTPARTRRPASPPRPPLREPLTHADRFTPADGRARAQQGLSADG